MSCDLWRRSDSSKQVATHIGVFGEEDFAVSIRLLRAVPSADRKNCAPSYQLDSAVSFILLVLQKLRDRHTACK